MLAMKPANIFNLQANTMSSTQSLNGAKYTLVPRHPDAHFTGDAVAAEGVR
jgi:hypothetical protein